MTVEVVIVDHPIVADSLASVRSIDTPNGEFRRHVERVGLVLMAEATRHLPTQTTTVTTPLCDTSAVRLVASPVLVPVLRAGLGLLAPAQQLLPDSPVGFVGVARDEHTFEPVAYVNKLADDLEGRPVIVLDPMLATGGSLLHVINLLTDHGNALPLTVVCLLAAPEGIDRLRAAELPIDVTIVTASVDERLNESAFIVPGLGDAGDRLFGRPG
jgi:uracil phosphoribosyltransferase